MSSLSIETIGIFNSLRVLESIEWLSIINPKVWKYKDRYTLILGSKFIESGSDKFTGEVLFYTSEDGENWSYKNRYYDKKIGDMWECPDLFEVDNEYILIMLRNI